MKMRQSQHHRNRRQNKNSRRETVVLSQRDTARWIERLARYGYAAKGAVYSLVGLLAFHATFTWSGEVTGSEGALRAIAQQPLGSIWLLLIALGLVGYVFWQCIQAIYDPEHDDVGVQSVSRRLSYALSGGVYGSLSFAAFRTLLSPPWSLNAGEGGSTEQVALLLAQPRGQWLVGSLGVAIASYGFYCIYRGLRTTFWRRLKFSEMTQAEIDWATRMGRFGLMAKGTVSIIMGYFFTQAGRVADPEQAKTTEGALQAIQQQPFGAVLTGIIALGLIAYGIHLFVQARYRRISP